MTTNKIFIPTKEIVATNDKITKCLFTFPQAKWIRRVNEQIPFNVDDNKSYGFIEGSYKEPDDVRSKYNLLIDNTAIELSFDEYENLFSPLNMFDRAVMTALASEWIAGNVEVTIPAIYRLITGKQSGRGLIPTKLQADAILASVKKLACVRLQADLSDACKKFKYNKGKPLSFDYTPLINCTISDGVFFGKDAQIISIDAEPILYTITKAKKHLVTFPRDWLNTDVDIRHKTYAVIAAKFYTAVRVAEIYGSKKLKKVIKFEDVLKKCGLSDKDGKLLASYKVLMTVRKAVFGILNHLKSEGVLKSFEIVREGNGIKFTKIHLAYERHSKS